MISDNIVETKWESDLANIQEDIEISQVMLSSYDEMIGNLQDRLKKESSGSKKYIIKQAIARLERKERVEQMELKDLQQAYENLVDGSSSEPLEDNGSRLLD